MNRPAPFTTTTVGPVPGLTAVYLHVAIFRSGGEVIDDAMLRLVQFKGQEALSQPFEFELELHGNTSERFAPPLSFDDLVGRPVTVGILGRLPPPATQQTAHERAATAFADALAGRLAPGLMSLFNGIVASFAIDQPGVYRLTMRPALWRLGLCNAYRVHARCNIRDAIAALMQRHGIDASVDAISGSDNPAVDRVQDWLQAGESDDEFLQRLMAKAHVYYYFVHSARGHRVVFANRPAYPEALPDGRPLRYAHTSFDDGLAQGDTLTAYSYRQSLVSGSVSSVLTREEAAWEADAVAGLHSWREAGRSRDEQLPFVQHQVTQYGGSQAEAAYLARATQELIDASAREFSGASLSPWLRSGHLFGVTQQPRGGQNPTEVRPELEGRRFVLTRVQHEATLDGHYRNEFAATDAARLAAPFSMQHTQQGSVHAVVVGAGADAAPADWRYAGLDSCDPESALLSDGAAQPPTLNARGLRVRLATAGDDEAPVWIKLAPHMQTVPEIGATVLVARAQDHSELPEIQSIVQSNASQVVMPSGWTASTTIGSSISTTYGDAKSLRLGSRSGSDWQTGAQALESRYASGQYREVSYAVGGSWSYARADNGAAGLLSDSESVGNTHNKHTAAEVSSASLIGLQSDDSAIGITRRHSAVGLSSSINAVGASAEVSMVGASTSVSMAGARMHVEMSGAGANVTLGPTTERVEIRLLVIYL